MILCLNRPGSADLTAVDPIKPSEIKVTGFSIRRSPYTTGGELLGEAYSALGASGFDPTARTVATACGDSPSTDYELAVQVERTGPDAGRSHGFVVHYTSHGLRGTLTAPYEIILCPTYNQTNPDCQSDV